MKLLHHRLRQRLPVLEQLWYRQSWRCWLLWPLSLIYQGIVALKAICYRLAIFKTVQFPVPIIVVGNITVGGTGKSPFCIALCEHLKSQGYKLGLVSRGYGGQAKTWPQRVTADSDPLMVGDEPVLLVRRTQCPMVVAPDRVTAVELLLAEHDCDVVISDDGLQHFRLGRAAEVVLVDKARGFGNGLCLPAGPLREPKSRLKRVDAVVEKGGDDMQIVTDRVYALADPQQQLAVADTKDKRVVAMAGIGNPQRFFTTLHELGFEFSQRVFADHHRYTAADLKVLDADIILMTEKDAIKCQQFNDPRCYALAISAKLSASLLLTLQQRLG